MKIDVFWCTAATSDHRQAIASKTLAWWEEGFPDIEITLWKLDPARIGCSAQDFNRERRIWADTHAHGDAYILTDDDCILLRRDMLARGLETLQRLGESARFAILSAWPENATIQRWTPGARKRNCICQGIFRCEHCGGKGWWLDESPAYEDLEVSEHVSVGGLRFCIRGMLNVWPKRNPNEAGYDMLQAEALREKGWRVGYFQHVRMLHLGEGCSDLQSQFAKWQSELEWMRETGVEPK